MIINCADLIQSAGATVEMRDIIVLFNAYVKQCGHIEMGTKNLESAINDLITEEYSDKHIKITWSES